jgi:hypothetical protein
MVAKRHKITNVPLFKKCPSKRLKKLLSRKKKNYVPHFLKQRNINSYTIRNPNQNSAAHWRIFSSNKSVPVNRKQTYKPPDKE